MVASVHGYMSNKLENFWKRRKRWFTVLGGPTTVSEAVRFLCTRTSEGNRYHLPRCLLERLPRTNFTEFDMIEFSGHDWIKRHVSLAKEFLLSRWSEGKAMALAEFGAF